MPILNKCCCCGSLRAGAIISGVLGVVVAVPTLILILVLNIKMKTIIIDTLPHEIVKIIIALNLVMTVLISVLLIWGAVKRNKFMMLPWIMLSIMIAIGGLISVIWTAVEFYDSNHNTTGTLVLVFGLLGVALMVYLWLVVLSYYQQLVEESHRGTYGKVPHRQ
ncbi:uncharacterized protein LOC111873111 [Cryptotermes secundus]|uniref:uncharacterized protein LOC111873111 n=1 Tax=Cryptotermes secundus TaxID=105785 RepID=UPI000CD7D68C|nr:uncharacterized protein LOC111873111 [Cryptotermes secundus]XP_023723304.1 uncharacterized protein LOC111873111 [Cryptotermes secundus]